MGHGNRSVERGLQQQETNGGRWIFDFLSRGHFLLTYTSYDISKMARDLLRTADVGRGQYIVYHYLGSGSRLRTRDADIAQ